MTDFSGLLPPPVAPPVFDPGDAAHVVRAGRRRRHRTLAAAGAGTTLCALLVAALLGGGDGRHALVPTEPHRPDPRPSPTPATAAPAPAPAPAGHQATGPAPSGAVRRPAPVPDPTGPPGTPAPAAARAEVTRETVPDRVAEPCDDDLDAARRGWCFRYVGPASAASGGLASLRVEACRPLGHGAATLAFDRAEEVTLAVWPASGGRPDVAAGAVWTHDAGSSPHRPHTVAVAAGTCARWTVPWDLSGVPAGDYAVTAVVDVAPSSYESDGDPQSTLVPHPLTVEDPR